ncbi:MAG: hydrogenase [Xanthomonadaceae bacterium]|nr:hydrogenase [Xanthomonadaceae bacterium]
MPTPANDVITTTHREGDDLLTAGLGGDGLRAMKAPTFADPVNPIAAELRRRAIWNSWRGIADLGPTGGYGSVYGSLANVPGREYSSLSLVPGARQPHRVLAQVPDAFDAEKRCLVVTVASGSRGVYGAMAVGAAWGLPRGCAVVHTDKAAGSDYFDLDAGLGVAVDGRIATAPGTPLAFVPATDARSGVAVKHAHSQDNPEADWGRHTRQAAEFGLRALAMAFPDQAPFTFGNTRVIAVGISNGGGAVLRAAEIEGDWLDGVVAGEPNVMVEGHGGRALYDYTTEAALLMPCALPALGLPALPTAAKMCEAMAKEGVIEGRDLAAQQQSALAKLRAAGWSDAALVSGATSTAFDLWRSVAVTYASAYTRSAAGAHPCGYGFSAMEAGVPRAATAEERAAWWSDGSGIPPGAGVHIVDPQPATDMGIQGLRCLRGLWTGEGDIARQLHAGVAETRAAPPRQGLPVIVVHGTDDGLIPAAFSSAPYVAAARAAGRGDVRYWQVRRAQHFDAFLALPQFTPHYVPLLPYVYAALDRLDAHLDGKGGLPEDALIDAKPRASGQALQLKELGIPD